VLSAVDNALEKIIGARPLLLDYQLRSIGAGEDAQGDATIKLGLPDEEQVPPPTYTGHGLSTNVIEASLRAYIAAINKLLSAHPVTAQAVEHARAAQPSRPPKGKPGSRVASGTSA
jgi:hypothetical protein